MFDIKLIVSHITAASGKSRFYLDPLTDLDFPAAITEKKTVTFDLTVKSSRLVGHYHRKVLKNFDNLTFTTTVTYGDVDGRIRFIIDDIALKKTPELVRRKKVLKCFDKKIRTGYTTHHTADFKLGGDTNSGLSILQTSRFDSSKHRVVQPSFRAAYHLPILVPFDIALAENLQNPLVN